MSINCMKCSNNFFIIFFYFLGYSNIAFSLQKENYTEADSITLSTLREAYHQQLYTNLTLAIETAQKILDHGIKCNNKKWQIFGFQYYGSALMRTYDSNNLNKSVDLLQKGLKMSRDIGDSSYVAFVLDALCDTYIYKNELKKAMKYTNEYVVVAKFNGNTVPLSNAFATRAKVYQRLKLYQSALRDYDSSKFIISQNNKKSKLRMYDDIATFNQALIYHLDLKEYEKSFIKYKQALNGFSKRREYYHIVAVKNALGKLFLEQGEYKIAKKYSKESLRLSKDSEISSRELEAHLNLAEIYMQQNLLDSAIHFITRASYLSDSLKDQHQKIETLKIKAQIFELQGNYTVAMQSLKEAYDLEDSLETFKDLPKVTETLLKNESTKHDGQLNDIQKLLSLKNSWIWSTSVGILILSLVAIFVVRRYRSRLSSMKQRETNLSQTLKEEQHKKGFLNRELVLATANLAMKNEALKRAKSTLQKVEYYVHKENILDEAKEAKKSIGDALTLDKMWDTFFLHFSGVYPGFYESLQSRYKLSNTELKICAFLKMNLTSKEICQIINLSQKSIPTTMHRLKNKLGLSGADNVYNFIHNYKTDKKTKIKK